MPIVELDNDAVETLFASIVQDGSLREVTPALGGLVNAVYRVVTSSGATYALRLYPDAGDSRSADERFGHEVAALRWLAAAADVVRIPRILAADASRTRLRAPYVVYPWIDGITLNDCRRQYGHAALTSLANPLGRALARISAIADRNTTALTPPDRSLCIAAALIDADAALASSPARERLGSPVADALRATFAMDNAALLALDEHRELVHGDFGGRNILVRRTHDVTWDVSGVLDWEAAAVASPLWDVGSLFRYDTRYSAHFRASFARGYRAAGGRLPDEWWRQSRLIDATRVVRILNGERELPSVFDECRAILASVVADFPPDRPHFVRNRARGR